MDNDECLFYHILGEGCINRYNPTLRSYLGECKDKYCPKKHPEFKEEKEGNEIKQNKKKNNKKKKVMKRKKLI